MTLKLSKKKVNGDIDDGRQINEYKNDSGLTKPFTKLVRTERIVDILVGKKKEATFLLSILWELLGGKKLVDFLANGVVKEDTTKDSLNESVKMVNKPSLGNAMMLPTNENAITSKPILNDVTSALVSEQPSVKAHLKKSLHHLRRE